jgi:hypothetical protein
MLPAFAAALAAIKTHSCEAGDELKLPLIQKVIEECERRDDPALTKVLALLWRFAAEAARTEAEGFARDAIASAMRRRLPSSLDFSPANDDVNAEGADFDRPGSLPAQVELRAELADPSDDRAPRIELPLALIAALDDAA